MKNEIGVWTPVANIADGWDSVQNALTSHGVTASHRGYDSFNELETDWVHHITSEMNYPFIFVSDRKNIIPQIVFFGTLDESNLSVERVTSKTVKPKVTIAK